MINSTKCFILFQKQIQASKRECHKTTAVSTTQQIQIMELKFIVEIKYRVLLLLFT